MALIKCKECGAEVSTKAAACPQCGAPVAKKPLGCGAVIGLIVLGLLILGAISNTLAPSGAPTSVTHQAAAPTPAPPPMPGAQWSYRQSSDPMAKGTNFQASVTSSNTANFSFPYAGNQHARLLLRTHPRYGKDIIFSIEKGQFLCRSYEDCTVIVRFDDAAPENFAGVGPEDNSTTTIFIRNYARFVEKMAKAKRVRISANVYQHGAPVFDFDVSGFDSNKYTPKR